MEDQNVTQNLEQLTIYDLPNPEQMTIDDLLSD